MVMENIENTPVKDKKKKKKEKEKDLGEMQVKPYCNDHSVL